MYEHLDTENRVYLIFCDIGNFRHWVNESTNPNAFFSNLDKLKSALTELCDIDYNYDSPTPTEQLTDIINNEQQIIQNFLSRSWINIVSEAKKLKTEKGRKNKIEKFFNELAQYSDYFSNETKSLIEKAKGEMPDYSLNKTTKAEKDLLFLSSTEKIIEVHNQIIDNISQSNGSYSWFYNNRLSFEDIIGNTIPLDTFTDIIKLMLSSYNYKKAARFLRIKYGFSTQYGIEVYVAACMMIHSHTRIIELSRTFDYYSIGTHSSPCPVCKAKSGNTYKFSEAEIGTTYPPFCRHNCSHASPFNK